MSKQDNKKGKGIFGKIFDKKENKEPDKKIQNSEDEKIQDEFPQAKTLGSELRVATLNQEAHAVASKKVQAIIKEQKEAEKRRKEKYAQLRKVERSASNQADQG